MGLVNNRYLHQLAEAYWHIDNRGLKINGAELKQLKQDVRQKRADSLSKLSGIWGIRVYVGAENKTGAADELNLNTPKSVQNFLKSRGYVIPLTRKKDTETFQFTMIESTNELAIRRAFANETDPQKLSALSTMLDVREYNTLNNRYINARLHNWTYYSNYNVSGPVTGRRACRKTCFGLGGNAQNFPHHYDMGERFLECIVARKNKLFFIVDQMQAEDWPVSALAENHHALDELRNGVDRHTNLAAFIFGKPKDQISKKSIERYLGKKCRHAYNYGMREQMMSDSLAKEGKNIPPESCKYYLKKVAEYDPAVDGVFHNYIKTQVFTYKKLDCPLGRERYFLGLRPNDTNHKIINEAYSYIPQNTVGDNTGLTVLDLHTKYGAYIVNEAHDSITDEVEDEWPAVERSFYHFKSAFDREITFHNGISINIPIEGELGYDLKNTVKIGDGKPWSFTLENVKTAYEELKDKYKNKDTYEDNTTELSMITA